MNTEDIRKRLCIYDVRNPNRSMFDYQDMDLPGPMEDGCSCDSCYYGSAPLANALLASMKKIEHIESRTHEH